MGGETREGRGEVPEHQNEPVWARSCVRDEGKGGSRCPSTRTCPHGLVLVFETGREEGRFPNTRTNPHGLVLVVETRDRERRGDRAPERAHTGMFWCSRWGGERGVPERQNEPVWARSGGRDEGEETEHQNVPLWARSGVRNVAGEGREW